MALLLPRTYLGAILKQGNIVDNRAHKLVPHILLRRNAATATLKATPKTTGKAKAPQVPSQKTTRKISPSSPVQKDQPSTTRKAKVSQVPSQKATHKSSPSSHVQKEQPSATPKATSATQVPIPENAAEPGKTAADPPTVKAYQDMSEEEREKELQRMLQMSELMPTMDLFGQEINNTLDVMIPYPKNKSLSFKKRFQQFQSNVQNSLKNATALNMLSAFGAIPGVWSFNQSLLSRIRHKFRLFGLQSTRPDSLIAPFRQIVLELYEEFNTALASRNERDVKKFTTWDYQTHALGLMKTSLKNNPSGRLIWQFHRVVEPVQILSLRVTQGHFGEVEPKFGNRLLAHALVKFDTEQSLEIYDNRARPLHPPAAPEKTPVFIDAEKKPEKWRVPAVKRRVQEYLVLEKRMWAQGPWVFREQMWPTWPLEEAQDSKK